MEGRAWRRWLLALLLVSALPAAAGANGGPVRFHGDRAGVIVPWQQTAVTVVSEVLTFDLAPGLDQARVTAAYLLANASDSAQTVSVAFAIQGNTRRDLDPEVSLAGARLPFQRLSAESLPPPDTGETAVLAQVRAEWGGEPAPLVDPVTGTAYDDQDFFGGRADLEFLRFTITLAPRGQAPLTVAYTHGAARDAARWANDVYHYDYLLRPARYWAGFGGLTLTVQASEPVYLGSSLDLRPVPAPGPGQWRYQGVYAGLPADNLTLGVMSRRGILLEQTAADFYTGFAIAATLAAAVPMGLLGGHLLARIRRGWLAVLAAWWGVGAVTVLTSGASFAVVQALLRVDAAGRGSFAMMGWLFAVQVAATLAILLSLVVRWWCRRHRAVPGVASTPDRKEI